MEPSSSNIKKFLIVFQKKAFLIFREMKLCYISGNGNPPKNPYIFSEESLSYISGKGKPEKVLTSQEVTFRTQKMKKTTLKKFLIFQEVELSSTKIKKLLILQEELPKPENQTEKVCSEDIFCFS